MKHSERLTRAYKGLSADQLAALAFHYMADANELEFTRVESAVPRDVYRCPDLEYQVRRDAFFRFATLWAIEHWRMRCRKAELLGAAVVQARRGDDPEKADDLLYAHEQAEKALLALDAALVAICKDRGIEPNDVRKIAGVEAFTPSRAELTPDAETVATFKSGFSEFFSSSGH